MREPGHGHGSGNEGMGQRAEGQAAAEAGGNGKVCLYVERPFNPLVGDFRSISRASKAGWAHRISTLPSGSPPIRNAARNSRFRPVIALNTRPVVLIVNGN